MSVINDVFVTWLSLHHNWSYICGDEATPYLEIFRWAPSFPWKFRWSWLVFPINMKGSALQKLEIVANAWILVLAAVLHSQLSGKSVSVLQLRAIFPVLSWCNDASRNRCIDVRCTIYSCSFFVFFLMTALVAGNIMKRKAKIFTVLKNIFLTAGKTTFSVAIPRPYQIT